MNEEAYYPTTYWHSLDNYIEWRRYKHPLDGHRAVEGLKTATMPDVVEARHYRNTQTDQSISAVFSYPKGIGMVDDYFWEIYPTYDGDIERFSGMRGEADMEESVVQILQSPNYQGITL